MKNKMLSFCEAKQISLVEYLSLIGFEPQKIRGNNYWYHSPFRSENTPSFKIDIKLNLWYDHGVGEGGSIIELGMKLHQCTAIEFLNILSGSNCTVPTGNILPVRKKGTTKVINIIRYRFE